MRRLKRFAPALAVLALASAVVAPVAADADTAGNMFRKVVNFWGGLQIGQSGTAISDSYAASSSIDFSGVTDQCEDSSGITVTGASANDVCVVGPPATMACTHCWVSCYVSAANTVKVRLCAHGASGDPAAATYAVRVFDP